jgi:hypothetical protein
MATLSFPALTATRATWGLTANTDKFTSPFTGTTQTIARPGARWSAVLEFASLTKIQAGLLDAFLASLEGQAGRFYLHPHHRPGTQSAGVVNGAGQTGKTLAVSGYTPGNLIFRAGDFIEAGGELKMVTTAATANGSGLATLAITPAWRASPANGSAVAGTEPKATMMLASNAYAVTRVPGDLYDTIIVDCLEAF